MNRAQVSFQHHCLSKHDVKCPISSHSSALHTLCPAFLGDPWLSLREVLTSHLSTTCFPSILDWSLKNELPTTHQQVAAPPTDCSLGSLCNPLKSKFSHFLSGDRHWSASPDEESRAGEKTILSCSSSSRRGLSPTGVSDGSLTQS